MIIKEISGVSRRSVPEKGVTIYSELIEMEIPPVPVETIKDLTIYKRTPEQCLKGIGNWMIDMVFKTGDIFYWKLPIEMSEEAVLAWAQPLIDDLNKLQQEERNQMN